MSNRKPVSNCEGEGPHYDTIECHSLPAKVTNVNKGDQYSSRGYKIITEY